MIIERDSFTRNEDIQTFIDFIYSSVEKKPITFLSAWTLLLEISQGSYINGVHVYNNHSLQVFRALVFDAERAEGKGASLYQRSVCNAVAGWDGKSEEFTDQEVQQIFKTVKYLEEIHNGKSIDSSKISGRRISTVSWIYQSINPSSWAVYNPQICFILEKLAQDFQKTNAAAAERLGDLIRFPSPALGTGIIKPDIPLDDTLASIKFVQASLLLRCFAEILNANRAYGPPHFVTREGKWELCHAEMAFFSLSMYSEYIPPERDPLNWSPPDEPAVIRGRLTDME
jgi:hypothetical protein